MSPVQIQLPLLTATLVLQHEPGIVVVVWANIVIAAEPVIQHAYTHNELLLLEKLKKYFPVNGFTLSPNRIVSTIRSEKSTTTRHRDANTRQQGKTADEEHEVTTVAVAAMVQPPKGTVNNITVNSATRAVNTHVQLCFQLETGCSVQHSM